MRARKRFGQHFLTDAGIIDRILSLLGPMPEDNLVEIGPGRGALTFPLLSRVQRLQAVELDRDLIAWLTEASKEKGELVLHACDALEFDFGALASQTAPLRLIGNLPYNISTPLMFHLFSFTDQILDMVFMVQEEVARRLTAAPGSKAYGRLTVMAQYHCAIAYAFTVPPEAFAPPPQVVSAIITLKPYATKPFVAEEEALMATIVTAAFSQRRKTVRNTLKAYLGPEDFQALGLLPTARAEALSVEDFVNITNYVSQQKN